MSVLEECQLVIFDMDGVLLDSEHIALDELRRLMQAYGVAVSETEAREKYLGVSVSVPATHVAVERADITTDQFKHEWHERLFERYLTELSVVQGAIGFIEQLRDNGLPYCIATGSSVDRLEHSLRCANIDHLFTDRSFSADIVERGKPEPDVFLLAANTMGVHPHHCVVIEDASAGITGAIRAGMMALGFIGGSHLMPDQNAHRELLLSRGASHVFDSFSTLSKHFFNR